MIQEGLAEDAINNHPEHPGIVLEEADGYRDIGKPFFDRLAEIEGSPRDPFYKGWNTSFGPDTQPDTRSNTGRASGIHIEVLSAPGDTMEVAIRFERVKSGWPLPVAGAEQVRGADVDGEGAVDLLVGGRHGVWIGRVADGALPWSIEGVRLLAGADADTDGRAEIFVARGRQVEAWQAGASQAQWISELETEPQRGLFTDGLALFPGRPVLALASGRVVLLDARTGEQLRQESREATGLTVADLDGEGGLELVLAAAEGGWKLGEDGLEALWEEGGEGWLAPVAGDLDGDGRDEIVLTGGAGMVRVLEGQGAGFSAVLGDSIQAAPALGDLDNDGFLEMVLVGADQVHVLRHNNIQQADFPTRLARSEAAGRLEVAPVLLDLDGDGQQEIFLGTRQGVYGVGEDGALLPGFPLLTAGAVDAILGADLDGDGLLELAALAGEFLYVWEPQDFSPAYEGRVAGWGQAGFSAANTFAHIGPRTSPEPDPGGRLLPADRVYCYPNPVAGGDEAHLRFFLSAPARLELEVFDAVGERVERLHWQKEEMVALAENEITWSTSSYASGLYLCRLEAKGEEHQRAVAIVRMAVSR